MKKRLLAQWKPALAIACVAWLSIILSGRGWLNPSVLGVFCQALVGLALANSLVGFEPLPVAQSVVRCERRCLLNLVIMLIIALVLIMPAMVAGSLGMSLGKAALHETNFTREAARSFNYDAFQMFFVFLWGAGIAEETVYRLVAVSLVWRLTKSPLVGVLVGALLFGAYHLSPLDGLYLTFLKFPVSQFLASAFIGIIWGVVYVKRGYETAVLAHTLQDWVPLVLHQFDLA
jgi:membrane protease YdiL (CAAX protease family)